MLKYLIAQLLFILLFSDFAQSQSELEKRNGFKNIKLGASIDSIQGTKLKREFKEKGEYPALLYGVGHPDYERIGEVQVDKIEVKTYNGLIYEIRVVADKDPRLMKALESIYGKANYDMKNEMYFWKTDNISLKFSADGKHHLELLYTSNALYRTMKLDKNKKVGDISDDF